VLTIAAPTIEPGDVVIESVSHTLLPTLVPSQGIGIVITGQGFGTNPSATLNGVPLTILGATDSSIDATIPGGTSLASPVVLTVVNTRSNESDTFSGFTLTGSGGGGDGDGDGDGDNPWEFAPANLTVTPSIGSPADFPVTVNGENFNDPEVLFGSTVMPVDSWTSTQIVVAYPPLGISQTGLIDVTVRNGDSNLFTTATDAFTFVNDPQGRALPCFIATAAYGTGSEAKLDTLRAFRDGVLLKSAAGAALVDAYYRVSPPIADEVAQRPLAAAGVRAALWPLVAMLDHPLMAAGAAVGFVGLLAARRRRRQTSC
jgi:hypothetical protein